MKRHRNVKIVATLGPASNDYEMIRALHEAGADVLRLNMSHGDHAEIKARHAIIRQVEKDLNSPIAIWRICRVQSCASAFSPMAKKNWCRVRTSALIWTMPKVM